IRWKGERLPAAANASKTRLTSGVAASSETGSICISMSVLLRAMPEPAKREIEDEEQSHSEQRRPADVKRPGAKEIQQARARRLAAQVHVVGHSGCVDRADEQRVHEGDRSDFDDRVAPGPLAEAGDEEERGGHSPAMGHVVLEEQWVGEALQ